MFSRVAKLAYRSPNVGVFRTISSSSRRGQSFRGPLLSILAGTIGVGAISSSLALNDGSGNVEGVSVDSSIDAFPQTFGPKESSDIVSSVHRLIASGVRSVTFISFKVYGVGIYVPTKDESKIANVVSKFVKEKGADATAESVLNDKEESQKVLDEMAQKINYAIRITPVRNTDFGHLRDGFVKTILSTPFAKTMKEEVGEGIEQLREVFRGVKGSVPKNDSLYVVSENNKLTFTYIGKDNKVQRLGTVTEESILRVLLVLYLSSVKPISEPLRKDFVSYVKAL